MQEDNRALQLGRIGRTCLASCDDSFMMRQAHCLGLLNAYVPRLKLNHHLDESRFQFPYAIRLMKGYGFSQVLLETLLKGNVAVPSYYRDRRAFLRVLVDEF